MQLTPTPGELHQHANAVQRLRAELFAALTPADYFIVPGTEKVLPPYVDGRLSLGRAVSLGGLQWDVSYLPK